MNTYAFTHEVCILLMKVKGHPHVGSAHVTWLIRKKAINLFYSQKGNDEIIYCDYY